jgi:hypothetical protein
MKAWGWVFCAGTLVGCVDGGTNSPDSGGSSGLPGSSAQQGASSGSGTGSRVSSSRAGGSAASGTSAAAHEPVVVSAQAMQAGPNGADVVVHAVLEDADADLQDLEVTALDAAQQEVLAFDANGDGELDQAQATLGLGTRAGGGPLTWWLHNLRAIEGVTHVKLRVTDRTGLAAETERILVSSQAVRTLGTSCDAEFVLDRCEAGSFCRGTPTTCQPPVAPAFTRVSYLRSGDATLLLMQGTDLDQDATNIHLEWLGQDGAAVSVDQDGDGTEDGDSFDLAVGPMRTPTFFLAAASAPGFGEAVASVRATPSDAGGRSGEPITAALGNPVVRNAGQTCDPLGFDVCAASLVCSPGQEGVANTCRQAASLRAGQCSSAPTLSSSDNGVRSVAGMADGASVWDPPPDCATNNPTGRPEYVARLHVAQAVTSLTLSSDHPSTDFDTIVYLLRECADTGTAALACNDDVLDSARSSLTLEGLAAGDYLVVVDSFGTAGGYVELSLDITP